MPSDQERQSAVMESAELDNRQHSGNLLWSEDFEQAPTPNGVNNENWSLQCGDGSAWNIKGWGNHELQSFTEDSVSVRDGQLVITASKHGRHYHSARLRTFGKRDFMPESSTPDGIRVEARIKLPSGGQGIWPAFWMLPSDCDEYCSGGGVYGTWPASGEIDIMEAVNDMTCTHASLHFGGLGRHHRMISKRKQRATAEGFHVYAVDWCLGSMTFSVDGEAFMTACPRSEGQAGWFTANPEGAAECSGLAPFDKPFHILLNLSVGGRWPGSPAPETEFPQTMVVDYVRVWKL